MPSEKKKVTPAPAHPHKHTIDKNSLYWYGTGVFDYLNVSLMYGMYATQALTTWFLASSIFVIYPAFLAFRFVDAYCAWVHAIHDYNSKKGIKSHNLVSAIVTTLTVLLVGGAVAGTFMGIPMLATVLFGANLALMAGFRLFVGMYEAGKASVANRIKAQHELGEKHGTYKVRSISQFAMFAFLAMTASAGICINLLGIATAWPLGVVGGILGAGLCAYGFYEIWKSPKHHPSTEIPTMEVDDEMVSDSEGELDNTSTKTLSIALLSRTLNNIVDESAKEANVSDESRQVLSAALKGKLVKFLGPKADLERAADEIVDRLGQTPTPASP